MPILSSKGTCSSRHHGFQCITAEEAIDTRVTDTRKQDGGTRPTFPVTGYRTRLKHRGAHQQVRSIRAGGKGGCNRLACGRLLVAWLTSSSTRQLRPEEAHQRWWLLAEMKVSSRNLKACRYRQTHSEGVDLSTTLSARWKAVDERMFSHSAPKKTSARMLRQLLRPVFEPTVSKYIPRGIRARKQATDDKMIFEQKPSSV